mmetsp:Transcript_888/g.1763  ORF Transcript_888/g.1763 Transcript_888/m.1763 type:complete len:295 (-) Transcript_888:1215-2099(-)
MGGEDERRRSRDRHDRSQHRHRGEGEERERERDYSAERYGRERGERGRNERREREYESERGRERRERRREREGRNGQEVDEARKGREDGRDYHSGRGRECERGWERGSARHSSRVGGGEERWRRPQSPPRGEKYDPVRYGSADGQGEVPHDRAITRAMKAHYQPSSHPRTEGDPHRTLFVGRLPFSMGEEELKEAFEQYGKVRRCRVVKDILTGESRGYGFVEYESRSDYINAYHRAHRRKVDGQELLVDYDRSRLMEGWVPRRLGGGLGGTKYSGQMRFGGREKPFHRPHPRK